MTDDDLPVDATTVGGTNGTPDPRRSRVGPILLGVAAGFALGLIVSWAATPSSQLVARESLPEMGDAPAITTSTPPPTTSTEPQLTLGERVSGFEGRLLLVGFLESTGAGRVWTWDADQAEPTPVPYLSNSDVWPIGADVSGASFALMEYSGTIPSTYLSFNALWATWPGGGTVTADPIALGVSSAIWHSTERRSLAWTVFDGVQTDVYTGFVPGLDRPARTPLASLDGFGTVVWWGEQGMAVFFTDDIRAVITAGDEPSRNNDRLVVLDSEGRVRAEGPYSLIGETRAGELVVMPTDGDEEALIVDHDLVPIEDTPPWLDFVRDDSRHIHMVVPSPDRTKIALITGPPAGVLPSDEPGPVLTLSVFTGSDRWDAGEDVYFLAWSHDSRWLVGDVINDVRGLSFYDTETQNVYEIELDDNVYVGGIGR